MLYSNNGCRNETNDVDKLICYWGVSNDPCIFTNIVGAGIDTEEKRNMLLCTITAPFEKHRQNWETFFLTSRWNSSYLLSFQIKISVVIGTVSQYRVFEFLLSLVYFI